MPSAEEHGASAIAGPSQPERGEEPVEVVAPQTRMGHISTTSEDEEEEEEKQANSPTRKKSGGKGKTRYA